MCGGCITRLSADYDSIGADMYESLSLSIPTAPSTKRLRAEVLGELAALVTQQVSVACVGDIVRVYKTDGAMPVTGARLRR